MPEQTLDCATFDEYAAELALGLLDPRDRDLLVGHAAACDRCQAELETMSVLADRLSTLAPEAEPPVGFESAVVAAMDRALPAPTTAPRRRLRWVLAAAAALVVLAGIVAVLATRNTPTDERARTAVLTDATGARRGIVIIAGGSHGELTMSLSGLDGGAYRCSLRRADGSWAQVAEWQVGTSGGGTWAVPVDASLRSSPEVEVTESDGTVAAHGTLT